MWEIVTESPVPSVGTGQLRQRLRVTMAVSQVGESSVEGWWPGQASVAVIRRMVYRGSESGNDVPSVVSYRAGVDPMAASILRWRIRKAERLETGWLER